MIELINAFGIFGTLLLIVITLLWVMLPFAVFGIKDRQDRQTRVLKQILRQLELANGSLQPEQTKVENPGKTKSENNGVQAD